MSKIITVHGAIALAMASQAPLVFTNSDTKQVYRSRHTEGCLLFDVPGRPALSQGQFLTANRYSAMTQSGEFEEDAADENENDYPDLSDVIEWASDDGTTDEELQAYVVDVIGEDDRKRKRETNVQKIVEYVESELS